MRLEQKVPLAGVLLLAALASLLFLIEHVRTVTARAQAPAAPAIVTAPPVARAAPQARTASLTSGGRLIIPVRGIAVSGLSDTWGQARSEGRSHEGIDIIAPFGAPVLAATDGRIVKFFDSVRGGVTIYQFDERERFVYYYAHLSARAGGLSEGAHVTQGQLIGFVGATGNATTPHLHFEIQRLGPERRWWVADALNPYPYLLAGQAPR